MGIGNARPARRRLAAARASRRPARCSRLRQGRRLPMPPEGRPPAVRAGDRPRSVHPPATPHPRGRPSPQGRADRTGRAGQTNPTRSDCGSVTSVRGSARPLCRDEVHLDLDADIDPWPLVFDGGEKRREAAGADNAVEADQEVEPQVRSNCRGQQTGRSRIERGEKEKPRPGGSRGLCGDFLPFKDLHDDRLLGLSLVPPAGIQGEKAEGSGTGWRCRDAHPLLDAPGSRSGASAAPAA